MSEKNNKYTPNLRFPEFTGEWEEKKLGEVGYFVRGLSYNKSDVTEDASSTLVIRSNNIIQDSAVDCINGLQYVTKTPSEEQQLEKGDIVICLANGSSNLVGKTSSFDGNYTGVVTVGAFCGIFRSSLPICKYLVQTSAYKNKINLIKQGGNGALANLYGKDILGLSFFIPTAPEEQQKIASCLSAMDDLIAAQAEKVEALKEKKTGLMQQMFPQAGETTPRLRFPEFTGEWELKKLGEVAKIQNGYAYDSTTFSYEGDYVIRISDIQNGTVSLTTAVRSLCNVPETFKVVKGDILIAMSGATTGKIGEYRNEGKAYINQRVGNIKPFDINKKILLFLMQSDLFANYLSGILTVGAQPNISSQQISSFPFLLPPSPAEQEKIASCLSALDDQIAAETEKLTALKDYKKGLMQQLFPQPAK